MPILSPGIWQNQNCGVLFTNMSLSKLNPKKAKLWGLRFLFRPGYMYFSKISIFVIFVVKYQNITPSFGFCPLNYIF